MNRLTPMPASASPRTTFSSVPPAATVSPPSVVRSSRFSGTRVQKSGFTSRAIRSISSVAAISRFSTPVTVSRSTRTSRSWMWRRSSRRCTVMPCAPASSHSVAAATGSG